MDRVTNDARQKFSVKATTGYMPIAPRPRHLFCQIDTLQVPWKSIIQTGVTSNPTSFNAIPTPLSAGTHTLYAYTVDDLGSRMDFAGTGAPMLSALSTYSFTV